MPRAAHWKEFRDALNNGNNNCFKNGHNRKIKIRIFSLACAWWRSRWMHSQIKLRWAPVWCAETKKWMGRTHSDLRFHHPSWAYSRVIWCLLQWAGAGSFSFEMEISASNCRKLFSSIAFWMSRSESLPCDVNWARKVIKRKTFTCSLYYIRPHEEYHYPCLSL